jgi:hypothetical protein
MRLFDFLSGSSPTDDSGLALDPANLVGLERLSAKPSMSLAFANPSFGVVGPSPMTWPYGQADGNSAQNLPQFLRNIPPDMVSRGLSMLSSQNYGPGTFPGQSAPPAQDALPTAQLDDSTLGPPAPNDPIGSAPVSPQLPRSARDVDEKTMQRVLDYLDAHPGVPDNGFPSDLEMRKAQLDGALQAFDTMQPRTNTMQDRENYEYAINPEYKSLFDKFDDFTKNYGQLPSGTAYLRQELKRRLHEIYNIPNYETDEPAYERDAPWIAKWKFERQQRNNDL